MRIHSHCSSLRSRGYFNLNPCCKTLVGFALGLFLIVGCTQNNNSEKNTAAVVSATDTAMASRGQALYQSSCIACHNMNPKNPGSSGPDVWGSSLELITARVLHGKYPEGYKPKRETHMMVAITGLKEADITALHAYLNQ